MRSFQIGRLIRPWLLTLLATIAPVAGRDADVVFPAPSASTTILIDDLPDDMPHVERTPIFMWMVRSETRIMNLVGSLHMATADIYPLPARMTNSLKEAEVVAFEVDPSAIDDAFRKKLYTAGTLPSGQTLREMIPPETRSQLEAALRRNDAPLNSADEVQPWLAALLVTFSESFRQPGDIRMNYGIDRHFISEARRLNKRIVGLESTDDQIALFSSLSDETSLEFLDKTLQELEELGPLITRMIEAWKNGDDTLLWNITRESFAAYPDVYREWLVNRNQAWMDELENAMNNYSNTLVVVGAAHLVGPDGLPELLRARGYEVKQVME